MSGPASAEEKAYIRSLFEAGPGLEDGIPIREASVKANQLPPLEAETQAEKARQQPRSAVQRKSARLPANNRLDTQDWTVRGTTTLEGTSFDMLNTNASLRTVIADAPEWSFGPRNPYQIAPGGGIRTNMAYVGEDGSAVAVPGTAPAPEPSLWATQRTRVAGGAQLIAGGLAMAATLPTAPTGVGAVGFVIAADFAYAGAHQLIFGETRYTFGAQAISAVTGTSVQNAELGYGFLSLAPAAYQSYKLVQSINTFAEGAVAARATYLPQSGNVANNTAALPFGDLRTQARALKNMGFTQSGRRAMMEGYDLGLGLTKFDGNPTSLADFARTENTRLYNVWKQGDLNMFNSAFPGSYGKLQQNLTILMDNAKSIKVNLNGLLVRSMKFPALFRWVEVVLTIKQ